MSTSQFNPWNNPPEGLIAVGEVLSSQGNKGEIKLSSLTNSLERWLELKRVFVFLNGKKKELFIEKIRYFKDFVIAKFQGVEGIPDAERLSGTFLWIPEEERPSLPADHFYVDQILGLKVYSEDNQFLGRIKEVLSTGANDVYVLSGSKFGEILFPALKPLIHLVNCELGIMRVEIPPGLLDGDR